MALSRDCGRSWGEPRTIASGPFDEPVFLSIGERLVGLAREDAAKGYWQFGSDDCGATCRALGRTKASQVGN